MDMKIIFVLLGIILYISGIICTLKTRDTLKEINQQNERPPEGRTTISLNLIMMKYFIIAALSILGSAFSFGQIEHLFSLVLFGSVVAWPFVARLCKWYNPFHFQECKKMGVLGFILWSGSAYIVYYHGTKLLTKYGIL